MPGMDLLTNELNEQEFLEIIQRSDNYDDYLKIVKQTDDWRKTKKKTKGCEIHHIIPRCFGGSNDDNNLIKLTTKEHLLAHYYLALMTGHIHMFHCFNWMMGKQFKKLSQLEVMELEEMDKWALIRDEARLRRFSDKAKATIAEKAKLRWERFRESGRIDKIKENISNATKTAMASEEARIKVRVNLGCKTYYNPETDEEMHWYEGDPIPQHPWRRGRRGNSEESRKKLSNTLKTKPKKWYYNDELQINRTFSIDEEIPDGWKPGQPKKYSGNYTKLKKKIQYKTLTELQNRVHIDK